MPAQTTDEKLKHKLAQATKQVKQGDLDNAILTLKSILEQQAGHEIALGMLASIYLQIGLHEQAVGLYEKLLLINPDNPLARFQLGMARLNGGDAEEALAVWEPMLDLDDEFMANFHSALALTQLGRNQEAVERLVRAGRHMPSSHPLYAQLVNLHAQLIQETAT